MWKRPIRAAVHLGLDRSRLRAFVQADLKARRPAPGVEAGSVGREFVDRHGVRHPLDATLRDRLKPGWRSMVDPVAAAEPPSDDGLRDRAVKAAKVVAEAATLVAATVGEPLEGRILEVGCYDGASAYQLAHRPGTSVVASDLARYYVVQRPGATVDPDLSKQQELLARIRERAAVAAGMAPGLVEFVEDDISRSGLEAASFDAIVSFEMLEHVARPAAAFAEMARLVRPGGILYHDYNPFFSSKGGHSLCTLAIPWGHARLDADDFERYLSELRPTELDQALRFYRESLNRMTLADLRASVAAAGLELLALVPWFERGLVESLDPSVLPDVQRLYPTAVVDDLLATFVAVIARRPDPHVTVRPATTDDVDMLLAWANDPATRAQSFRPDRIEAAAHDRWLAERLVSPSSRLFIGLEGSRPIGQVRFDRHRDGPVEVGISVAGDARNRGLGRALLATGLATARLDEALAVRTFVARVRLDNHASAALFRGAGFRVVEQSVCNGIPCLVFELQA